MTGEADEPQAHPRDRLRRSLGLTDATMLVVASTIGSGIFLTPGRVADLLPAVGWILAVWLVGGALSVAGALANAELGAMYPRAGGDYVYLREAYHPLAGFTVGWLTFFAIYAGSIATLAIGFAHGLVPFVPLGETGALAVAIGLTLALSLLNYLGVRLGARLNNVTGWAKIVGLLAFAAAALLLGRTEGPAAAPAASTASLPLTTGTAAAFGLALSPVLFTYLGWNAPVYVASELRRPGRTLPLALFLGLAICTVVYLVVNLAYLIALPIGELRATANVGEAAASALFGPVAGTLVGVFVLASILGTLNALILVGPRIAYAMALDGLFVGRADAVHATFGTPHRAIVLQAVVAIGLLLVFRDFPRVLDYTTFAIVLAMIADTAALYTLRRRRPELPRPYRAWGYPLVPGCYLVANVGIAAALLWGRPLECLIGLLVAATALPVYGGLARRAAR